MPRSKAQSRQTKAKKLKNGKSSEEEIKNANILNEVKAAQQELEAELETEEKTILKPFDDEPLDSDEELQVALATKRLKPGLNVVLPAPKQYVNNVEGLKRKLEETYLNMDWVERLDITVPKEKITENQVDDLASQDLADNDFKREKIL